MPPRLHGGSTTTFTEPQSDGTRERNDDLIELIRQYLAILRKDPHEPGAEAELEKIYLQVVRQDPNHRLAKLHEMVKEGVSFNITEQVRDLLAEEITALDPISPRHLD